MELRERKKGKENDRTSAILHTTNVEVEDIRMWVENC
jgi:hypothetical protein